MSILQRVLDMMDQNVDNVAGVRNKVSTNSQPTENIDKNETTQAGNNQDNPNNPNQQPLRFTWENQNVDNVACAHEIHTHLGTTTYRKTTINKKKNNLLLRASNNVNKCEDCPASGYWDYAGPGRYCFHRAYYLGKSGYPEPCRLARNNCPLTRKDP